MYDGRDMGSVCSLESAEILTRRRGVRIASSDNEPVEHEMSHEHHRERSRSEPWSEPFLRKPCTVCSLLPMYFDSICELTCFYCGFVGHA